MGVMGRTARTAALGQSDLPALRGIVASLARQAQQANPAAWVSPEYRALLASPESRALRARLARRDLLAPRATGVRRLKRAPKGTQAR
jgi:uncharacterized protein with von Willebrand factor type A (vWA) domain